ncbi:MAG: hypothetical protein KAU38_11810 [Desulfobacterales bacterium]|nr:hypothetical protein [Desulfobacterales bacterium]
MGGRFGKYGNAKRKAQIRKKRLRPPDLRQAGEEALERSKMWSPPSCLLPPASIVSPDHALICCLCSSLAVH